MFYLTVHNAAAGLLLWAQQAEDIDSIVAANAVAAFCIQQQS